MERRKPGNYHDMKPNDGSGDDRSIHRILRNILAAVMVILILLAAAGLYWMFSPAEDEPEHTAEESDISETELIVREALGETAEEEPAAEPREEPEPDPSEEAAEEQPEEEDTGVQFSTHRMEEGETVESIADEYGLDPRTIVSVNDITSAEQITEDMELRIPDRDGKMYTIRAGDSLSLIASEHGMGYITLARENNMDPDAMIYPGNTLFIPRITMSMEEYERIMGSLLMAPVEDEIVTEFGEKLNPVTGEAEYPGIEFGSAVGTAVRAVMDGEVTGVYDDSEGLGRYLELVHDDGYETVYGHLERIHVEEGEQVSQGDEIAESGSSGMTLDPVLYFSISRDGVPVDPREFF